MACAHWQRIHCLSAHTCLCISPAGTAPYIRERTWHWAKCTVSILHCAPGQNLQPLRCTAHTMRTQHQRYCHKGFTMAHLDVSIIYAQCCSALLHCQLPHLLLKVAGCRIAKVHRPLLRILWSLVYSLHDAMQNRAGHRKATANTFWGAQRDAKEGCTPLQDTGR